MNSSSTKSDVKEVSKTHQTKKSSSGSVEPKKAQVVHNGSKPQGMKRYMPKLLLEEDLETKSTLVKITGRTGIRQVIQYATSKIKAEWKVTLNAFSLDLTKALQATEIIKTRLPFLHQENQLISRTSTIQKKTMVDGEEKSVEKTRISSGISITLSRIQFEVKSEAGYQKPKPSQFVQPRPRRQRNTTEEKDVDRGHLQDLKKKRGAASKEKHEDAQKVDAKKIKKGKRRGSKRNHSKKSLSAGKKAVDSWDDHEDEYHPEDVKPHKGKGGQRRMNGGDPRDFDDYVRDPRAGYDEPYDYQRYSGERRRGYPGGGPRDQLVRDSSGRYDPYVAGRRGSYDYRDHSPGFHAHPRAGLPKGGHYGPPRGGRYGPPRGAPSMRGGRPEYEMPERPGYYAGRRQFRADQMRDPNVDKLHNQANAVIEREREERMLRLKERDQRNDPRGAKDGQRPRQGVKAQY